MSDEQYSIGRKRVEELNQAEEQLAASMKNDIWLPANLEDLRFHLDNFLLTIPEDSRAAKRIKERLEYYRNERDKQLRMLEETEKDADWLEQSGILVKKLSIEREYLKWKYQICFETALEEGLFFE